VLEIVRREVFLSKASEEADRGLDVAVGLDDQRLGIEISDEKAAKRLGIERPAPCCRFSRRGSNLRYAGDRNQRDAARLENSRHCPQRRLDIGDEHEHLSEYHAVESAIGYLRRIDQVGDDCGLGVVCIDVRYD
jgi:hypothetical protein